MLAAFERVAGRARISTAKLNKNQHTPLYRLDFRLLYFISAFSYPNIAIDARSVGYLCESESWRWWWSMCSDTSLFLILCVSVTQTLIFYCTHTHTHTFHLFPEAVCNTIVKTTLLHFPDNRPQNSSERIYGKRLIKSSFRLETPTDLNFSVTHSNYMEEHLSTPDEKVSIVTPHLTSWFVSLGMQETGKGLALNSREYTLRFTSLFSSLSLFNLKQSGEIIT